MEPVYPLAITVAGIIFADLLIGGGLGVLGILFLLLTAIKNSFDDPSRNGKWKKFLK